MCRSFNTRRVLVASIGSLLLLPASQAAWGQEEKPNILIIWGDDVGMWNVSLARAIPKLFCQVSCRVDQKTEHFHDIDLGQLLYGGIRFAQVQNECFNI